MTPARRLVGAFSCSNQILAALVVSGKGSASWRVVHGGSSLWLAGIGLSSCRLAPRVLRAWQFVQRAITPALAGSPKRGPDRGFFARQRRSRPLVCSACCPRSSRSRWARPRRRPVAGTVIEVGWVIDANGIDDRPRQGRPGTGLQQGHTLARRALSPRHRRRRSHTSETLAHDPAEDPLPPDLRDDLALPEKPYWHTNLVRAGFLAYYLSGVDIPARVGAVPRGWTGINLRGGRKGLESRRSSTN